MSTCFVLVQTLPGREEDVHARLAGNPSVAAAHVLFHESIAVKLNVAADSLEVAAKELTHLDGVVRAALYRTRKNT
ncbi:MAG TPA: hypothetical protein VNZ52_02535 [Candidatus Thermoplasmatota archaeon]|nr:hypothetical protein [Candidatus Thermoplasmatota archaeon]